VLVVGFLVLLTKMLQIPSEDTNLSDND